MANESYIRNASSAIQNDLKIFLGKEQEILAIETMGRTVAGKWYLAWDQGKIYVANPSGKLVQYGGSREQLSEDEIKTLINTCTASDFSYLKKQIAVISEQYTTFLQNCTLLTELENVISEKVDDYINSKGDEFSYTKTEIDSKDSSITSSLKTYVDNKFLTQPVADTLYLSIDNKYVEYCTGDKLLAYKAAKKLGIYICTEDSSTDSNLETVYKGKIYNICKEYSLSGTTMTENIVIKDINDTTVTDNIIITLNGTNNTTLKFGDNFDSTKTFSLSYNCITSDQISGYLSLYNPYGTCVKSDIDPTAETFTITGDLTSLAVGTYKYKITGKDINGNDIIGYYTINVGIPTFYASTNETITSDLILEFNTKYTFEGVYHYSLSDTTICYICFPATNSISEMYLNGELVELPTEHTINVVNNNITKAYKYYNVTLTAGEYYITIL